jgi:hypothetical protein
MSNVITPYSLDSPSCALSSASRWRRCTLVASKPLSPDTMENSIRSPACRRLMSWSSARWVKMSAAFCRMINPYRLRGLYHLTSPRSRPGAGIRLRQPGQQPGACLWPCCLCSSANQRKVTPHRSQIRVSSRTRCSRLPSAIFTPMWSNHRIRVWNRNPKI